MRICRATILSAFLIGLAHLCVTSDSEASRRKPRPVIIEGEIQQLSGTQVLVNNIKVELISRTVFQDYFDAIISREAFAVGDCVKIKLVVGKSPPTAREMELEDDCASSNSSSVIKPTPTAGAIGDDKGGRCTEGVRDDRCEHDSAGKGRGRGRGRGGDRK